MHRGWGEADGGTSSEEGIALIRSLPVCAKARCGDAAVNRGGQRPKHEPDERAHDESRLIQHRKPGEHSKGEQADAGENKNTKIGRDAKTREFIPVREAQKRPSTTTLEALPKP